MSMSPTPEMIEAGMNLTLSSVDLPAGECLHESDVREIQAAALALLPGEPVAILAKRDVELFDVNDTQIVAATLFPKGTLRPENEFPVFASPAPLPVAEKEVSSRWRIFEDTTHGYWGIELEQAGNDDDLVLYPIKIHRDTVARIVDAHNAGSMSAPLPVAVKASTELDRLMQQLEVLSGYHITSPPTADAEFVRVCNGDLRKLVERFHEFRSALSSPVGGMEEHPDDLAVDRFAAAMKAKLAKKRAEGYGGWDNPEECTIEHLTRLLINHLAKGDPVDIGNFAMMIHQRGGTISPTNASDIAPLREELRAAAALLETLSEELPDDDVSGIMMKVMAERNRSALQHVAKGERL